MAELALEGVSKRFADNTAAVVDLDLTIRDHELVVLVGPSGCGKTTTLRLIAGLEDPSAGVIRIGGRVVNRVAPCDRDIAMVFQSTCLYPHLSVYENMAFGWRLRRPGNPCQQWWNRIRSRTSDSRSDGVGETVATAVGEAARIVGIEHLLERMPRQLSGGERQRVALGRAIVRRPAAFLFDEPLSNIDAPLRGRMRRELKILHRRLQATMVYVTHDQSEALSLGDRVVVIDGGRIQQIGSPREVYEEPKNMFVAAFLGATPMNFVPGRCDCHQGRLQFLANGMTDPLPLPIDKRRLEFVHGNVDADIVMGLRPEHLECIVLPASARAASPTNVPRFDGVSVITGFGSVRMTELLGELTLATVHIRRLNAKWGIDACRADGNLTDDGSIDCDLELTVSTQTKQNVKAGTVVALRIDATQIRLFDSRSTQCLN